MHRLLIIPVFALALAACEREKPVPAPTAVATAEPAPVTAAPPVGLQDVVESQPGYMVGITFPKSATRYPGLAADIKAYADAARAELVAAAQGRGGDGGAADLYDLSLTFTDVMETPDVVAVSADGSSYTGGAHGKPLLERFVWLPRQNRRLTAERLVPDAKNWKPLSDLVREQLHTALSQRLDADELTPEERAEVARSAGRMIDQGTTPNATSFRQFEPVPGPGGKLAGLKFVFPPYQVGPYSDGVQSVQLPASALLPLIAAEYRDLFATK
ncbi:DUF3298 domain-containing protein [Aerolutibacter ruishenii]|uniref:Uncharacterized protein DUF3298 n=1 Tax=Aerolutibacter ruishenii TaxID=686800 RepID=A0A562LWZ6_9GAMM|nr:DUF3298 domain-containing protein [Lysobacter ruishenii]TWI12073.1 uncharacterized protein DUF3298 [Lysobacter ruishenii]